jgi:hypothetical protein
MSNFRSKIGLLVQIGNSSWLGIISLICVLDFSFFAPAYAQTPKAPQIEFAGASLGAKVTSLGIMLDDYKSVYQFKGRYFVSGNFSEPGHPIFMIELRCDYSDGTDQQSGIKCNDPVDKIAATFGADLEAFCSTGEAYDWEQQFEPVYFYIKKTNQFWYVNNETRRVAGFGIALPDLAWRRCIRKFSAAEIAQVKLGMNAQQVFGENFIHAGLQSAYMVKGAVVRYDSSDPNFAIKEISFSCKATDFDRFPKIDMRSDCGISINDLRAKYGNKINGRCAKSDGDLVGFYRQESKEYWSIDFFTKKVSSFGFAEKAHFENCDDLPQSQASLERLRQEVQSRKPHEPPRPLTAGNKVLRIKGIALGERVSACSEIVSEVLSVDRKIINTCNLKEGENKTVVYFDINKRYVVKVVRTVYVREIDNFMNDALNFYGKELFKKRTELNEFYAIDEVYEFGDTAKGRGLKINVSKCLIKYNDRTHDICDVDAKYFVTFSMIDIDAFNEAENDGRAEFKKREF